MSEPTPMTPEQRRDARLQATYGIDLAQYTALLMDQGGVCAICFRPPHPNAVLVVDHNHESGTVRGLLCEGCNTGIGLLGDDPVRLHAAIAYLVLHGHYVAPMSVPGLGADPLTQRHLDLNQAAKETPA